MLKSSPWILDNQISMRVRSYSAIYAHHIYYSFQLCNKRFYIWIWYTVCKQTRETLLLHMSWFTHAARALSFIALAWPKRALSSLEFADNDKSAQLYVSTKREKATLAFDSVPNWREISHNKANFSCFYFILWSASAPKKTAVNPPVRVRIRFLSILRE